MEQVESTEQKIDRRLKEIHNASSLERGFEILFTKVFYKYNYPKSRFCKNPLIISKLIEGIVGNPKVKKEIRSVTADFLLGIVENDKENIFCRFEAFPILSIVILEDEVFSDKKPKALEVLEKVRKAKDTFEDSREGNAFILINLEQLEKTKAFLHFKNKAESLNKEIKRKNIETKGIPRFYNGNRKSTVLGYSCGL